MKVIAHIENDYTGKFGVPRQSGIVAAPARIVFEPEFRIREAFRGLEGFSHIWLIWKFSLSEREDWSPTIRPPRLGGNERLGVFATRSPFRPNPLGLSCVKLVGIDYDSADGPALYVEGADLVNGTPIYDVKPYLAYTDSRPEATNGFAATPKSTLNVHMPDKMREILPQDKLETLLSALAQDPRPAYHNDAERVYGMSFADMNVKFRVDGENLYVESVEKN